MQVTFAAVDGAGDHGHGVARLEAARRGEEGEHAADDGEQQPRRGEQRERAAVDVRERLDRDVGDAEQEARRGAEDGAVVVRRGRPASGRRSSATPSTSTPASKTSSIGVANVASSPAGPGRVSTSASRPTAVMPTPGHWRRGTAQPKRRSPRTATTMTPVDEHRLDHRQGRHRERRRVQEPRAHGDRHAGREPLRAHQRLRALQWAEQLHGGRAVRPPVLAQEAQLCRDRACQRHCRAQIQRQDSRSPSLNNPTRRLPQFALRHIGLCPNVRARRLEMPTVWAPVTPRG